MTEMIAEKAVGKQMPLSFINIMLFFWLSMAETYALSMFDVSVIQFIALKLIDERSYSLYTLHVSIKILLY